jgi:hypothetical protein
VYVHVTSGFSCFVAVQEMGEPALLPARLIQKSPAEQGEWLKT